MTEEARQVEEHFFDDRESDSYDRLWDVLDRILEDPVAAPTSPWAHHVSTRDLWGSKIPGSNATVFWRISGDTLHVVHIFRDLGV
jgi:hypothetical protein